uniref:Uncharacterized protein n=1 Tax=Anguilla anguilla TaxID=7936 RepID=A0A0E9PZY4_ANGAN
MEIHIFDEPVRSLLLVWFGCGSVLWGQFGSPMFFCNAQKKVPMPI